MVLRVVCKIKSILILKNMIDDSEDTDRVSNSSKLDAMNALQDAFDRVIESRDLFDGANEIGIMHDGALYRLRVTRAGKLILNK
jgi:hemin uptake protein HemP